MKRKLSPLTCVGIFISLVNAIVYGLEGNVGAVLGWFGCAIYAFLYLMESSEVKRK